MKKPSISIVIPNWNGEALLKAHLPATLRASKGCEIIVVDDASTDKSVELLKNDYPQIALFTKVKHQGFSSTVNLGVSRATGEIVVLLNTDVEPEADFLWPLIRHFNDPLVFAVGCMDKSLEGETVVLRGRGVAIWQHGFLVHSRGEVDRTTTAWVSGGSGAFRKSIWDKLGGMDTLFDPFYWEDIDLSYRATKAGFRLVFEPKSVVNHFHENGKIKEIYNPRFVRMIAHRNQFQFIWKNLSDGNMLLSHSFWTPIRLLQALIRWDLPFLAGYIAAICRLPKILLHRLQSYS